MATTLAEQAMQRLEGRRSAAQFRDPVRDPVANAQTQTALERHKREGMNLAVRARIIGMIAIGVMLPLINPACEMLYYELLLAGFVLIGLAQRRVGRVGRSGVEVLLIVGDLLLMTLILLVPNPLSPQDWPLAMQYRIEGFKYFFLILAVGTLAYSWRTVWGIGLMTAGLWAVGFGALWFFGGDDPALRAAIAAAPGVDPEMAAWIDPTGFQAYIRVQEIVLFLLVAGTLALAARRSDQLLYGHAALERERANLARYFSPNVVAALSHNDEPLKEVRTQDIAVLFVDIVDFTSFAASRSAQEVIETLRQFHGRMEREVFAHQGTLDKYLGDGLMATFGTPFAGEEDAANALRCALAMTRSVSELNAERAARGEPAIRASFGLHYGPAVLGDIGANRLEFAVIGNTVNVASRVEALTRPFGAEIAISDDLLRRAREQNGGALDPVAPLKRHDHVEIRGLAAPMTVWTLGEARA